MARGAGGRRRAYSGRGQRPAPVVTVARAPPPTSSPCQRTALINHQEIPGYWGHSILRGSLSLLSPYFPVADGEQTLAEEKANNKPGLAEAAGGRAAAALLAVFRIPFRPRVSPLPCRLNVSPLFCLDKVSPLFRERVSVFRLKVSPFRLKVPSFRGPELSSFLLPMLLVRDGSSILTFSDPLVSMVGSFSASCTHSIGLVGIEGSKPLETRSTLADHLNNRSQHSHFSLSPIAKKMWVQGVRNGLEIIFVRAQFPALKLL